MDQRTLDTNKMCNRKVMNVILGRNACGACMRLSDDLVHWDVDFVLHSEDSTVDCSLKNVMLTTFGSTICDIVSSTKFCRECIDVILKAFFFISEVQENYKHIQNKLAEVSQQMKWTQHLDETGSLKENKNTSNSDIDDKNEAKGDQTNQSKEPKAPTYQPKTRHTIILNNESLKTKLIKDPNMHKYLIKREIIREPILPPGITVKKIKKIEGAVNIAPHELLELKWADGPDYDSVIPNVQVTKNKLHSNEALIMDLMEKAKTVTNHTQYPGNYNYLETVSAESKPNLDDSLTVNLIQRSDGSENGVYNHDIIPQDLLELKWPEDSTTKKSVKIPVRKLNYKKVIPHHNVYQPQERCDDIAPHELLELNWSEEPDKEEVHPSPKHSIDLTKWLQDQGMSIIKTKSFTNENENIENVYVENKMLTNMLTNEHMSASEIMGSQNDNLETNPKTSQCNEEIVNEIEPNIQIQIDENYLDTKISLDASDQLRCALCTMTFEKFEAYKTHYKTHGIIESAKCYKCTAQFPVIELLSEHLLSLHLENVSYCNECFALLNQNKLAEHMAFYHDIKVAIINVPADSKITEICKKCKHPLRNLLNEPHVCIDTRCNECKITCIHERYLLSYREQLMMNKNRFKCCDCHFRYRTKDGIIKHANKLHLKHKLTPLRCKVCDIGFLLKGSLAKHINLYHTRCNNCRKVFESQSSMRKHKCTQCPDDFKCELCGQIFGELICKKHKDSALAALNECVICHQSVPIKCNMSRHMQDIHNLYLRKEYAAILYECAICEIDFKSLEDFSQHNQIHTSVHECHICAKIFRTKALFETHFQMHLAPQCDLAKSFKCSICNDQLIDKYAWAHHMQSHTDYEKCSICSKYIEKESLGEHLDSHELLENKFVCPHCSLISNSHNQFEVHVNRFHLQNRPYQCDICKKCFYSKYMVSEHIKTHSRPEKCSVCDKKFARKSSLQRHLRKHSNVNK